MTENIQTSPPKGVCRYRHRRVQAQPEPRPVHARGFRVRACGWNTTLGLATWIGRFLLIVPMFAVAGSLAGKKIVPASAGTFPTDGALFVGLLIGVILIIGGLTYFPAVALGPIEEHLAMRAGSLF